MQIGLFDNDPINVTTRLPEVITALKNVRVHVLVDEYQLHRKISEQLDKANIRYSSESRLGKGSRVDFLTEGGIAIEAKKQKPNEKQVLAQLEKYASYPEVNAIILVIERYQGVPEEINGKPCFCIGLNRLWGISSK
ncbi:hypothetical protein [Brevibacillus reuszeri]|uniref:hypothetical protein n=1 Tax=Brevibacillus reuszeri TaxID=54915 RepID=UPI001F474CE0|nr:hypothetical protein [Brevibacillus reuszeri]